MLRVLLSGTIQKTLQKRDWLPDLNCGTRRWDPIGKIHPEMMIHPVVWQYSYTYVAPNFEMVIWSPSLLGGQGNSEPGASNNE